MAAPGPDAGGPPSHRWWPFALGFGLVMVLAAVGWLVFAGLADDDAEPAAATPSDSAAPTGFPTPSAVPTVAPVASFTQQDADRIAAALSSQDPAVTATVLVPELREQVTASGAPVTPPGTTVEVLTDQFRANQDIGPKLAALVICLGRNSALSGGPGQVVLVGHSMGGLAIRCALQPSCSGVPGADGYVAQVITVGTPTHGSFLRYGGSVGNVARIGLDVVCESLRGKFGRPPPRIGAADQDLCQEFLTNEAAVAFDDGSTELQALRADSTAVPVLAIAGDIELQASVLGKPFTLAHGDGVVDQRSQQSWSTETANADCGQLLVADISVFGWQPVAQAAQTDISCWHGSEPSHPDVLRIVRDRVNRVNARLPRPAATVIRFDGIGPLHLGLTADDLTALGFVDEGNLYELDGADCVRYSNEELGFGASVDVPTGRVLAIRNADGSDLRTRIGRIGVGSTLADIRRVFAGPRYTIHEYLDLDFGQGSYGVVVDGPGGSIGFGLDSAGTSARVDWVAGVGRPGYPPTRAETGC